MESYNQDPQPQNLNFQASLRYSIARLIFQGWEFVVPGPCPRRSDCRGFRVSYPHAQEEFITRTKILRISKG
jgi:hypothetical protein